MNPAVVLGGEVDGKHWRIGLITESLIRFEWSDSGKFVDDPTQTAFVRNFQVAYNEPVPEFTVLERDGWLEIDTPHLHVSYDQQPFTKEGLYVTVKGMSVIDNTWHYGDAQSRNLGGTARTLDMVNGATPLDPGVIGTDGWAVIDDSQSNLIIESDEVNGHANPFGTWVTPKPEATEDFYFFGYGHRYREAVHDFYKLTGPTPLLPRYTLGNWWSRYHRYTEAEYMQLVKRFEDEGLPFTTAVIDMDWHLVDDVDPKYGSGWTGYTWNKDFFPDPQRFLHWLHDHGMKTTLNTHPRDGIREFEDSYETVAKAMDIDPKTGEAVQFDLTDPKFMAAYFDLVHHPIEDEGVDFWWLDWQQGGVTRQRGLDPLWMLNYLHYLDSGRQDGERAGNRPLTFSRYAGPGSHRYPVGFSGDTIVTWESLRFQPYFTATASNIGYGWWSHDIGGHMFGYRDEELEARWYQLGVFSPINRLHSTDSTFNGKEPWNFHAEVRMAMTDVLRLRHAMIPYLYTMNRRAAFDNEPLVQPMYWDAPEIAEAYNVPSEFRFGTELLVSPIVQPADRDVQMAKADVWLPQGTWFDFFTGRRYDSTPAEGRRIEAWRQIDRIPVFAKAGAIVPLQRVPEHGLVNAVSNPDELDVIVFPGASGSFTLWEDNGDVETDARWASTALTLTLNTDSAVFNVAGVDGASDVVPGHRSWNLVFRGVSRNAMGHVVVNVGTGAKDVADTVSVRYDQSTLSLIVRVENVSVTDAITVRFTNALEIADNPVADDVFAVLKDAQMRYLTKEKASRMIDQLGVNALPALSTLEAGPDPTERSYPESHMPQSVIQALTEVLTRE
nr:TIM-barrel domain-containing protein [Bifidobacterium vansinderenii]